MGKNGIATCYRMGCNNPVDAKEDELPGCSQHGGETKVVWSVYKDCEGWLTDNDTVIEWVTDVDSARWFHSEEDAIDTLIELELVGPRCAQFGLHDYSYTAVRLK